MAIGLSRSFGQEDKAVTDWPAREFLPRAKEIEVS